MRVRPRSFRILSCLRSGRLVPTDAKGLHAGSVLLSPTEVMDWHSTHQREELLIILAGQADLEVQTPAHPVRRIPLRRGQSIFLAVETIHRIVNRSRRAVRYVYITAPAA